MAFASLPPSNAATSSSYRVYTSFCLRKPLPNTNISNWIECHDVTNNTNSRVSSIPGLDEDHILKDFAMIAIGGSIYIIGGRVCCKEKITCTNGSEEYVDMDVEVVSNVLCYDTISDVWTQCAPLNVPRYNFACTMHGNKIYVGGGQCALGRARGTSSAEVYDPVLNVWTPLQNMNRLRYKCVAVPWQGKIYVISGFVEGGNFDQIYIERCSAEVYDVETGKWDLVAGMWQLDVPPNQIVTVDGKLFSSGDCLTAWKGHIELYDEELNIWNMVSGSKFNIYGGSIERLYLTMAAIGTCLLFLAGYKTDHGNSSSSNVITSAVHIFDTSASENAWRSFEPLQVEGNRELCSHGCVVQRY